MYLSGSDGRRRLPSSVFVVTTIVLLVGCALIPVDESHFFAPVGLRFSPAHHPYSAGEILFAHSDHDFVDCATCHFDSVPAASPAAERSSIDLPSMALCFQCHDGQAASRECITCHIRNRQDRKPRFHDGRWPRHHKDMVEEENYKCSLCHIRNDCSGCHSVRRPMSHTPRFARSTHGRMATQDRRSCATCHTSGFCENCHSQPPPDHTPIFMGFIDADGNPRAGHKQAALLRGRSCLTCHGFEDACSRCHG